ncbi:MAG: hypothetical protein H0X22_06770 [Acidimicrobiia bacterium]|nr:hypothetical protein [Acidimicrobiia bacterium]
MTGPEIVLVIVLALRTSTSLLSTLTRVRHGCASAVVHDPMDGLPLTDEMIDCGGHGVVDVDSLMGQLCLGVGSNLPDIERS